MKIIISFLVIFFLITNTTALSRESDIEKLYTKATRVYNDFIKDKSKHKYVIEWEKCVNHFREIVIIAEKSYYADDAAYMVGYIYFRMYERFSNLSYLNSALSSFRFLLSHYPDSIYKSKTLYYTGFIHFKYRNDIKKSAVYFDQLIKTYPESDYSKQAKEYMDLMARASVPAPLPSKNKFSKLNNLKYWSSPDYTRVVVYLDSPSSFSNVRIYNPDRIYFDLEKTRISKRIADWMMIIENNFLKRVRIAHFNQKTTRVVLDLEKVDKYTVFTLNDPFRIVIDVTRGDKLVRAGQSTRPVGPVITPIVPTGTGKTTASPANTGINLTTTEKPVDTKTGSEPVTEKTVAVIPLKNSTGNYSIVRQLGLGVTTIVIDPGHGGKDPGMVVSKGVYEKDMVLDVALKLKKQLEAKKKYQVYLTRDKDIYVPLEERTAKAMQYKADLFISLHMNSYRKKNLYGLEIYYLGFATDRQAEALASYENSMNQKSIGELQDILRILVDAKIEESRDLARIISINLKSVLARAYSSFKMRGIKQAPFIVLIGANMPSILIELGYLSNPSEKKRLRSASYRQKMADGLVQGIEAYINNLNGQTVQR